MDRFEYLKVKFIDCQTESRLNDLGADGWELMFMRKGMMKSEDTFYFKRRLTPQQNNE